jgi:superfamily I DNA and/or RNA helicase
VIIDEAGQSVEPETLIPFTLLNRFDGQCILAGDPKQLNPVTISRYAKYFKFNQSMLERLLEYHPFYLQSYGIGGNEYDPRFVTKLKINYRSHPSILKVYNELFYNGEMEAAVHEFDGVEADLLAKVHKNGILGSHIDNKNCGVHFINVGNGRNRKIPDSCSWYNEEELRGIVALLNKCQSFGIRFEDIGITTPYALQVKKLKHLISTSMNVRIKLNL